MDTRVVFEPVTSFDKNIETLARVKGDCMYRRYFNMCGHSCENCRTYSNLSLCYNQLAACDQLRVDDDAQRIALVKAADHIRLVRRRRKDKVAFVLYAAFVLFLLILGISLVNADDYSSYRAYIPYMRYGYHDEPVYIVLEATHKNVHDCNDDGKVNCIDYTLQFKKEWDERYEPSNCEIIRNNNGRTKFHHLFVRCKSHYMGDWLYVEPQATDSSYNIYAYWGRMYSAFYNIYGETEMWMRRYVK